MKTNLGGERVGSGSKMPVYLRNYERSTHNLSQTFRSPMGVGILTPCYCLPVMRGDKIDINTAAGIRTIPSKGALFGSYKLQIDYYFCAARLYTGILHNNPLDIGLNMKNVYFPVMKQGFNRGTKGEYTNEPIAFAKNSLLHYLGLSGLGNIPKNTKAIRQFNAIPVLAYFDICKNYYINKQEDKAPIITSTKKKKTAGNFISNINVEYTTTSGGGEHDVYPYETSKIEDYDFASEEITYDGDEVEYESFEIYFEGGFERLSKTLIVINSPSSSGAGWVGRRYISLDKAVSEGLRDFDFNLQTSIDGDVSTPFVIMSITGTNRYEITIYHMNEMPTYDSNIEIKKFDIHNFDEMRYELLSHHTMGTPYVINDYDKLPYNIVAPKEDATFDWSLNPNQSQLNGLMLKTYQSDLFNNWLSSEYIDGVNGIAQITKVPTDGGGFTIDTLNFNEKMYNLLNRIAVSGNTYEDWQNVVYEDTPKRHLESPMYLGGVSQEIIFEEILSTAATEGAGLGQMGGRGLSRHRKGGHTRIKVDEAGFIIGIASITPRVSYGQGNEFYFTDLFTMDDMHKPALDGIGFQDLIGERLAYFDTCLAAGTDQITRHSIGKLPAWIEYMTAVDKVHGDFADDNENSFMVLTRKYEFDDEHRCIADATTYVEPEKYNDAFLYTNLDSQNFWAQIDHNVKARRKMSAKQIPSI